MRDPEGVTEVIVEYVGGVSGTDLLFRDVFLQETSRRGPNWTRSFLATLSPQQRVRRQGELQIPSLQADGFANAGPRIEQERKQDKVAVVAGARAVHALDHGLDFVELQVFNLALGGPLDGNTHDALHLGQMLGILRPHVAKKAVNRSEPDIAGPYTIVARSLQMFEEGEDPFDAEVLDFEAAGIAVFADDKLQQKFTLSR